MSTDVFTIFYYSREMMELLKPQSARKQNQPSCSATPDHDLPSCTMVYKWSDETLNNPDLYRYEEMKKCDRTLRSATKPPVTVSPAGSVFKKCKYCTLNTWMWMPREPKCPHLRLGTTCNHSDFQTAAIPSPPCEVPGKLE